MNDVEAVEVSMIQQILMTTTRKWQREPLMGRPRVGRFRGSVLGWLTTAVLALGILGCQSPPKLDVSALQAETSQVEGVQTQYPASRMDSIVNPDPASFTLGKGDQLEINVWLHDEFNSKATVGHSGEIELPRLGRFQAEGQTISQLRDAVTKRLTKYLKDPQVTIDTSEIVSRKVYVLGEVAKPGAQVFEYDYYFWNLLAAAGGFTQDADKEKILLLRKTSDHIYRPSVIALNFAGANALGFSTPGFAVQKDDIFYVMPTGLAKAQRWADKVSAILAPVLSIERATVLWPELIKAVGGSTEATTSTVIVSP